MQKLLLKNIKLLLGVYETAPLLLKGKQMAELPALANAWLACEDGTIVDFGDMDDFPGITNWNELEIIDCTGKMVMPSFVDSHTHIVYAGNRSQEFVDRIKGLSYEAIAAKGGGILNSAKLLRRTSEDELFEQSRQRLEEVISQGTGAIEIKSGYGLDLESELKMLRVIRRLKDLDLIPVKATFLGAHAVPPEFTGNKSAYIDLIIKQMIPVIESEGLADFIDVFCENNYFNSAETKLILEAGLNRGLKGKVHAEQLSHYDGIRTGVACGAISVDHLEYCNKTDMDLLLNSNTMPTILPGAAFFLSLPNPPAREMIDAGLPLAIASDYNPGSSPSGNMKLMTSIACIQYKLTPQEAINAATVNSAYAMDLNGRAGSITRGLSANLIITKNLAGVAEIPYAFGSDFIETHLLKGKKWN